MEDLPMIVGRVKEIKQLHRLVESDRSEFLAVYGRRRVGKTFLLREFFRHSFEFQLTGLANATTSQQLYNFHTALSVHSTTYYEKEPSNWLEAFQRLITHLKNVDHGNKKIVFFDEMPWLDTKGSDFVIGLEHFWNSWATTKKDVFLIACGSAASWMMSVLINEVGGLHNRVTFKIKIEPFTLQETEEMLMTKNCVLDRYQILQLYMVFGGIPYYLDSIQPQLSASQNIQALIFDKAGLLQNEYFNLYRALYKKYAVYEQVVEVLSTKTYGMNRKQIISTSKISSGGTLTKVLADLEESGFIRSYISLGGKYKNYRLSDYFTNFYFKFIKDNRYKGENTWINLIDNPSHRAWQGFSFEQICLDHIIQIKSALGINGILSIEGAWKGGTTEKSAQIDLLIDRRDQVINICEAKFSLDNFEITKEYAEKIRAKIAIFKSVSKTKKSVFLTMISTYGLVKNKYASMLVQNEITMDDLFE